jgi:hypothetical protein
LDSTIKVTDTTVKVTLSYTDTSDDDDETTDAYRKKLRSYIGKSTPV